jgi:hypothetical protein
VLMSGVVPQVAKKLGRDEDYVMYKLQRIDIPQEYQVVAAVPQTGSKEFRTSLTVATPQTKDGDSAEGEEEVEDGSEPPEDMAVKIRAVVRIQGMLRMRFARFFLACMKECDVSGSSIRVTTSHVPCAASHTDALHVASTISVDMINNVLIVRTGGERGLPGR